MAAQLMHQQLLCLVIEKIINKALSLNVNGNSAMDKLTEKTLTVQLEELGFPISLTVVEQQIMVTGLSEGSDCLLTTTIASLKELQKNQQLTELIKQEKLDIRGDLKVAQGFASIIETLAIDWQSELALHIGDIPTYKLGQFLQWITEKFQFAASQIQADASEWLVHEKKLVATSDQVGLFSQQVEQLSQRLNQLELRMLNIADTLDTGIALSGYSAKEDHTGE